MVRKSQISLINGECPLRSDMNKKIQNVKKFKNTLPKETGCIRILMGIDCVTSSRLDNTSMQEQKSEGHMFNVHA